MGGNLHSSKVPQLPAPVNSHGMDWSMRIAPFHTPRSKDLCLSDQEKAFPNSGPLGRYCHPIFATLWLLRQDWLARFLPRKQREYPVAGDSPRISEGGVHACEPSWLPGLQLLFCPFCGSAHTGLAQPGAYQRVISAVAARVWFLAGIVSL